MDINQLRAAVNRLSIEELQDFATEAQLRNGVNQLLNKPVRDHILAATVSLVHDRCIELGIKPKVKPRTRREPVVQTSNKQRRCGGRNGRVRVTKISKKEMEELWE